MAPKLTRAALEVDEREHEGVEAEHCLFDGALVPLPQPQTHLHFSPPVRSYPCHAPLKPARPRPLFLNPDIALCRAQSGRCRVVRGDEVARGLGSRVQGLGSRVQADRGKNSHPLRRVPIPSPIPLRPAPPLSEPDANTARLHFRPRHRAQHTDLTLCLSTDT
eukprot:1925205-Rhodomonas_salina.1